MSRHWNGSVQFASREVVLTSSDSGLGMDRVKQLMEEHLVSLESE